MKTDELIKLLAQDAPVRRRLGRMLVLALVFGIAASGLLLLSTVGLRADLSTAIETVRVMFKIATTLLLAVLAFLVVERIGRPGLSVRSPAFSLLLPAALLLSATLAELFVLPKGEWTTRLLGRHAAFCVFFIPVLSLAPLAGLMLALRHGAPAHPGLAGAAAGLAASAVGAALYAWHCPDDSPLFMATWYTLAIALVTLVGYGIGRKALRW